MSFVAISLVMISIFSIVFCRTFKHIRPSGCSIKMGETHDNEEPPMQYRKIQCETENRFYNNRHTIITAQYTQHCEASNNPKTSAYLQGGRGQL